MQRRDAAIGALLLALFACPREKEAPEAETAPRHVRCLPVSTLRVVDSVELRGTIAPLPERDASLAPQVTGKIVEVAVREGDVVDAEQPLARIESARYEDQAKEADAALQKARAERATAKASLARVERLFDHGIAPRQEVDDAELRLANAAAQESEARSISQRAHRELSWTTLRSSIAGTVLKVFRHSGELVDGTPATPIVEVADVSELELAGDATAQDLVRIAKGQTATITSAALPDTTWSGAVSAVAPAVDRASGLGRVRVALDLRTGPKPPSGVLALATIQVGAPHEALAVPSDALRSRGGADVEVIECGSDGLAHVREVRRGQTADGLVEVRSGLDAGARVVVDAVLGIGDGDPLEEER